MSDQPTLVDFDPVHRERLLGLWRQYFGAWSARRLEERWSWQFQSNPFVTRRGPRILVALAGDELVGHIAGVPLPIRIGGEVRIALGATGLVAEESQRWLGFRLVRSLLAEPPVLATAMAEAAEKLFIQCGAAPIPGSRVQFVFPRRYAGELAGKLRWRLPRWAGSLLTPGVVGMAAPWYRPRDQPRGLRLPRSGSVDIRPIDRFGPDYDALWQSSSAALRLTVEKTAEYMNWRYVDCPTSRPVRLGRYTPEGWLAGVAVGIIRARFDRFQKPCARVGEIVELIGDTSDSGAVAPLLVAAMHALDRSRVDAITTTGLCESLQGTFQSLGFSRRDVPEFSAALATGGGKLGELIHPSAIGYSAGDGDSLYSTGI